MEVALFVVDAHQALATAKWRNNKQESKEARRQRSVPKRKRGRRRFERALRWLWLLPLEDVSITFCNQEVLKGLGRADRRSVSTVVSF